MIILKICKKVYTKFNSKGKIKTGRNLKMFSDKEYANNLIYNILMVDKPCMIARIGSTEMQCMTNYVGVKSKRKSVFQYIKGASYAWWWEKSTLKQMENWSGFFPATSKNAEKFCEQMFQDMKLTDVLGSWLNEEDIFNNFLKKTRRINLEDLEPFFCNSPWTKALKGKKVLVVHPFAELIESQYTKHKKLFDNNLLPQFELKTIKAVQSLGGENSEFKSWFEAFESMKLEIDNIDFDVCILGCGAYGFPLAAHVKRIGKKSVHLGGCTQLLFGIIGKRWESFKWWPYMNLFNEYWVRPGNDYKPSNADDVEGACYW